jgi:hypothetical protein
MRNGQVAIGRACIDYFVVLGEAHLRNGSLVSFSGLD